MLQQAGTTLFDRYALPSTDYASHGGAFPVHVKDAGVIGSVGVSGLPQRDDHELVVDDVAQTITFRGVIDEGISRIVDALLALPTVIVALLALVALGPSSSTVIVVIGFTFAPIIARTVRASVLAERELDYVFAAQLRRENAFHIMFVEILPNVLPPILVEATVRLGYAIFAVASLSFIGFGIQPPSPDWGLSISANYGLIGAGYWWTVLFDGSAIATLVVAVNLVADGIQSALDE